MQKNIGEADKWSAIAAASVTRAFTELLSAFNRKLGEISGDRVCIQLANPAIDRGFTEVRPGRVAGETG